MRIPASESRTVELPDGARRLLAQISDKWTILILAQLCGRELRFNALRRPMTPITPKALKQTLQRLERNGLISRRILPGSPPGVEYAWTPLARSLEAPLKAMVSWSIENAPAIERAQRTFDKRLITIDS